MARQYLWKNTGALGTFGQYEDPTITTPVDVGDGDDVIMTFNSTVPKAHIIKTLQKALKILQQDYVPSIGS